MREPNSRLTKRAAQEAVSGLNLDTREGGGFSVQPGTGATPNTGHMVSYAGSEEQVPVGSMNSGRLQNYTSGQQFSGDEFAGGWHPGGDEPVYLDKSRQVLPSQSVKKEYGHEVARADSMTSALDLGISQDQLAVYDVERDNVVGTGLKR